MVRVLVLVAVGCFCVSCSLGAGPRPGSLLTVASWNVENLFDEVPDGGEYPEFDPSRGWTRAQFWSRCEALGRVVRTLAEGGPDVLVLEEIEGAHALDVLRTRFLGDLGYRSWFLAPPTVPGVKTAILSRYPLVRTGLHHPATEGFDPLRPIVEVELSLGSRALVLLANHWKSRIPTPEATEGRRRAAAQLLAHRIATLEARPDQPLVVALGDFNTSLELSRPWLDAALVPATGAKALGSGLSVYTRRAQAAVSFVPGTVWDPWETVSSPPGSYLYQGQWDRLDHAFLATSALRMPDWSFLDFRVVAYAPVPAAYGPRNPTGVSDHFPLVVRFCR